MVRDPDVSAARRRIGFVALGILGAAIAWDAVELWDQEAFLAWKSGVGYLPYFVGLALLPLVGIPTTPLFALAGATFPPLAALAGCAASIAVNLAISHWIARRWLREPLMRRLRAWQVPWPAGDRAEALRFLLAVRMAPGLPTFAKNYVSALGDLSFRTYLGVSWGITFLYATGLVLMGDSFVKRDPLEAAVALGVLLVGALIVRQARRRASARHGGTGDSPSAHRR